MIAAVGLVYGNESLDDLFDDYQPNQVPLKISPLSSYISIDLAAIVNFTGVVNFGFKNEGVQNGYDFGISTGKSKGLTQNFLYGSYLKFFDSTDKARYYMGIGARGGITWMKDNHAYEWNALFSAGRSFFTQSNAHRFLEINLQWPQFVHFHHPIIYAWNEYEVFRKNNFLYQRVLVAVLYGWFF